VQYEQVSSDRELQDFCASIAGAPRIAFDTEFVAEHSYRPQLCLVQVAVGDRMAVIDPLAVKEMEPFWRVVVEGAHETIVHAGREELLFCLAATGKLPANLFDLQIAAGLVGLEYPAGYGSLMFKLLGKRPHKGETRTDWRRRPLSEKQIDYALDDVRYLEPMRDELGRKLTSLGREPWMATEMADWQGDIATAHSAERWWRVSGTAGLGTRSLAIVRELWRWREREAARRDCPVRRVLRDDLIVELAKRRSGDVKHIRSLRGLERGDLQRELPRLAEAIERALAISDEDCPRQPQRELPAQLNLLGQFLASALTSICKSASLAPSIVGTASDVRELVAWHLGIAGFAEGEPPLLARPWRSNVVGKLLEDLLEGRTSIRIRDPLSEDPLAFDPTVRTDNERGATAPQGLERSR